MFPLFGFRSSSSMSIIPLRLIVYATRVSAVDRCCTPGMKDVQIDEGTADALQHACSAVSWLIFLHISKKMLVNGYFRNQKEAAFYARQAIAAQGFQRQL